MKTRLLIVIFLVASISGAFADQSAKTPAPMTLDQAIAYAQSHTPQQIPPLLMDLSTILYEAPSVVGPKMTAVLEKDGTLFVYWDASPVVTATWKDPNNSTQTLFQVSTPLPTYTQKNFYKAASFPVGDIVLASLIGVVVGVAATSIYALLK